MLYARLAARQENVLENAAIQEVDVPMVLSHASRYDLEFVMAHMRPIRLNP